MGRARKKRAGFAMRVIEAFDEPVRAAAVSPDGRFLAATPGDRLAVWNWVSGTEAFRLSRSVPGVESGVGQLAFTADGNSLVFRAVWGRLERVNPLTGEGARLASGACAGGIAVSPDGKTLVATQAGHQHQVKLEQWELPSWRPKAGIDFWSPFERLAF